MRRRFDESGRWRGPKRDTGGGLGFLGGWTLCVWWDAAGGGGDRGIFLVVVGTDGGFWGDVGRFDGI